MKSELDFFRERFFNPLREFGDLQRGINRLFEDSGWASFRKNGAFEFALSPACDIEETDSQYLMSLDLPGVKKDNLKIELNDRDLIVSGDRHEESKEDNKSQCMIERYHGSFRRVFALPSGARLDQIHASFENGVLRLVVPKAQMTKAKEIKIGEKPASEGGSAKRVA